MVVTGPVGGTILRRVILRKVRSVCVWDVGSEPVSQSWSVSSPLQVRAARGSLSTSRRPCLGGAWLHPVADCVSAAVRRNAFARALRSPGLVVDQSDLKEVLFTRSGDGTDESGPNGPEQVAEDMSTP